MASLRDLMSLLAAADPADKAQIYKQLGLALTYHPDSQTVRTEARPLPMYAGECPRGTQPGSPVAAATHFGLRGLWMGPRLQRAVVRNSTGQDGPRPGLPQR